MRHSLVQITHWVPLWESIKFLIFGLSFNLSWNYWQRWWWWNNCINFGYDFKNKVGIGLKWEICNRGFTSCWALWLWSEGWNEEAICASTSACFRIKIQSYCGWQKNLKRIIKLGIEYVSWKWIIKKLYNILFLWMKMNEWLCSWLGT